MNNMTQKLIRDGSTNARVRMNLRAVQIGGGLLALGFLSLLLGAFSPTSMEQLWSICFGAATLCGVITFLVVGLKDLPALFHAVKGGKGMAIGGMLILAGVALYGVSLATGVVSALLGFAAILAGIIVTTIAALRSER